MKIYAPDMALHEDLLRHARVCEILHDADEAKRYREMADALLYLSWVAP